MAIFRKITPVQIEQLCRGYYAGVDEVGRGPLIGDVVTAAVVLDPDNPIDGLSDSKKLSDKKRRILAAKIYQSALDVTIGRATPIEIDAINILQATMLAMQRAVAQLTVCPQRVIVDGNQLPDFGIETHAVIKGDNVIAAISAASIIAKVARDDDMNQLDARYPQYGFAQHKGYPTKAHFEALQRYGVLLPEYRKSFRPVKARLESG